MRGKRNLVAAGNRVLECQGIATVRDGQVAIRLYPLVRTRVWGVGQARSHRRVVEGMRRTATRATRREASGPGRDRQLSLRDCSPATRNRLQRKQTRLRTDDQPACSDHAREQAMDALGPTIPRVPVLAMKRRARLCWRFPTSTCEGPDARMPNRPRYVSHEEALQSVQSGRTQAPCSGAQNTGQPNPACDWQSCAAPHAGQDQTQTRS